MRRVLVIAILVITAGVTGAVIYLNGKPALYANADDSQLVAKGKTVYAEQCAVCHGKNLKGQPNWKSPLPSGGLPAPPHDATGHTWHHTDQLLFDYTKKGGQAMIPGNFKSNMPGFADKLTDDEIWAALAYIKSTWPARMRNHQTQLNQQPR